MAGPGNALAGRRSMNLPREDITQNDSIEMEFIARANELGYKGSAHDDIPSAMQFIWQKSPTDSDAELLDIMSHKYGVPPPWQDNTSGPAVPRSGPQQPIPGAAPNETGPMPAPLPAGRQGNALMMRRA